MDRYRLRRRQSALTSRKAGRLQRMVLLTFWPRSSKDLPPFNIEGHLSSAPEQILGVLRQSAT